VKKGLSNRERENETPITQDLSQLFGQFIEARQRPSDPKPLCEKTLRSYGQAYGTFRSAVVGVTFEEQLVESVRSLIDERLKDGHLSSSGMNVYIRGLNSYFSWCCDLGFLLNNVKIKLLSVERRKRPRTLETQEISNWKEFNCVTLSQRRVKHMALVELDTGIREEECLALLESDIDWSGSRLWVGSGKGGANREVPLSAEEKKALRRFLAETSHCRRKDGKTPTPIFCTKTGGRLSYRNALRDLKAVAGRLGLSWVSWHSFRRTFATQYIRNGGLLVDLQQILGHADIRTTILYLGNEIDEIVAMHDEHSPLSLSHKHRAKKSLSSEIPTVRTALSSGFRQR
jgi:site-specific recombinase XerD